jgi:carboxyl-terminal processing protease
LPKVRLPTMRARWLSCSAPAAAHGDAPVVAPITEATLPGHLLSEEEGALPGDNAGEVLDGDAPIQAALAELKKKQPAAR